MINERYFNVHRKKYKTVLSQLLLQHKKDDNIFKYQFGSPSEKKEVRVYVRSKAYCDFYVW